VWGCSKIKEELEKVSNLPGVSEKLEGKAESEE